MQMEKNVSDIELECLMFYCLIYKNGLRLHLRASTNSKCSQGCPPHPMRDGCPLIFSPVHESLL